MNSAILAGLGFGLFMAVSVGPTIFAIIKYSITYGWRAGFSFVLGVSFSDIIYVVLANEASGFLNEMMRHEKLIGYIGSAFFVIIGLYGYFRKIKVTRNVRDSAGVSTQDYRKIFMNGFLLNTLNPGLIFAWITSVAAVANLDPHYRFAFFSSCLTLILAFDFSKVLLAQRIRKRLTPRNIVYLHRISALCILLIGIFLFLKIAFDLKVAGH